MRAAILTIGDEILIGQITDTNSASISRHLNAAGIVVGEKCSIGDQHQEILHTLHRLIGSSQLVIITGGLGPTKDDITKHTLAEIFDCKLIQNTEVSTHVRTLLESRGVEYNELNQGQSLVPSCCEVLFNAHGTAPGMWFEHKGCVVVALPGVPFEMEHLMVDKVMPRLKTHFTLRQIIHRTMITTGLAESMLAKQIESWEAALPTHLKLAYLPNAGAVRLRLSAYEVQGKEVATEIDLQFELLRGLIPQYFIGFDGASIQELIHDQLTRQGLTLATAESCTGGAIAAKFTALPGASAYFKAGIVAYSNSAKCELLDVDPTTVERDSAVSEVVARQMAEGARRAAHTHYAIATTGIAGPSGGTPQTPIGTVWIAIATPTHTTARLKQCGTDRGQIIERASALALSMLRDELSHTK